MQEFQPFLIEHLFSPTVIDRNGEYTVMCPLNYEFEIEGQMKKVQDLTDIELAAVKADLIKKYHATRI